MSWSWAAPASTTTAARELAFQCVIVMSLAGGPDQHMHKPTAEAPHEHRQDQADLRAAEQTGWRARPGGPPLAPGRLEGVGGVDALAQGGRPEHRAATMVRPCAQPVE